MSSAGSFSPQEIRTKVRELGWWYQCFELPGGVMTSPGTDPAYAPETRWNLIEPWIPADLTGKTVLDVGGNAGYFSVQMARRGAVCTIIEPFVEFARQAEFVADLYQYPISVINEDVQTWCLRTDERFDYVIFLGLFYHLKYPGLVLDRLAEMTRERMYFQSQTVSIPDRALDIEADYRPGVDDPILRDPSFPRMAFIENLFNGDPTNWWIPNAPALEAMIRSSGMKIIGRPHEQIVVAEPDSPPGKVVFEKLVFPRYRKIGGAIHPGPQTVDPQLWARLLAMLDAGTQGE